jgi:hypothetical protein
MQPVRADSRLRPQGREEGRAQERGGEGRGGIECVRADAGVRLRGRACVRTDARVRPCGRIFTSADGKNRLRVKSRPRGKRGRPDSKFYRRMSV